MNNANNAENAPPSEAAEVQKSPSSEPKEDAQPRPEPLSAQIDDLIAAVQRLESFAKTEAKRVQERVHTELVPQIEEKAKKNIWLSLLCALGLGMILGIWLTGGRRRG